jgi:hypothetical protein
MKKMFWTAGLLLLLAACGQRGEAVEGNLILTNYAAQAISQIIVEYGGETLSSEEAVSDTQLCAFTLPEEEDLAYTVSFRTEEGETVSGSFTDSFAGETVVYLRADRAEGFWQLAYDQTS